MELDLIIFLVTLFLGNGLLIAIFTLIFNWLQNKYQRDFEARSEARKYYMTLYGHIAILDELARGYPRSIENGKAAVFIFKDCKLGERTSIQILDEFKKAYEGFSSFYIKTKCKGYEIFVSKKLKKLLSKFWIEAKTFYEDNTEMKSEEKIEDFHRLAEKTTNIMENLFGLK